MKVSDIVPFEALIDIVVAETFNGLTVTVFEDLDNPVGTVELKFPPLTLYVHDVIVVLDAVPTTVKFVFGVLTPSFICIVWVAPVTLIVFPFSPSPPLKLIE